MRWQSGTLRVAILTNIANIRENSEQKFKYDGKGIRLKAAILTEMVNLVKIANLANIRQDVSKNSNEMTKWPFESGDFDENGEIGVNDEYGRHSLKS